MLIRGEMRLNEPSGGEGHFILAVDYAQPHSLEPREQAAAGHVRHRGYPLRFHLQALEDTQ